MTWQEVCFGSFKNLETGEIVNIECSSYGSIDFGDVPFEVLANKVPAPKKGFVMFADSAPDINVPHLLGIGLKPEQIHIASMLYNDTVWRNDE
jgi:hypothetical protein